MYAHKSFQNTNSYRTASKIVCESNNNNYNFIEQPGKATNKTTYNNLTDKKGTIDWNGDVYIPNNFQDKSEEEDRSSGSQPIRTFHDSVHGTIMMEPLLVAIIDTPQFQRLRDIKQLGSTSFVYPSATHSRFEHCIGTSYLCGKFLTILRDLHKNVYKDRVYKDEMIANKDILCVKIAGLVHDLGHGPFSHVFDGLVIKSLRTDRKWTHEEGSCLLFEDLIRNNKNVREMLKKEGIQAKEIEQIKRMIQGDIEIGEKRRFLYEIVANSSTGIDCDKFDYIARDTHHLGMKNSFDFQRFFQNTRIMDTGDGIFQICVRDKEEFNLYELFHVRCTLHRQIYQHKTTKAIDKMLCDAFKEVDEIFKISKSIDNMELFTTMTDSIFYEILRFDASSKTDKEKESVQKAKEIIRKIQNREIYQFCCRITPSLRGNGEADTIEMFPEDIVQGITCNSKSICSLDIFVCQVTLSFGKKTEDPIKNVIFFGKNGQATKHQVTEFSGINPVYFEEKFFNVYCREKTKKLPALAAIKTWWRDNKYKCSISGTDEVQ